MNYLRKVLAESEQMRKEADDIGPAAELDHWKQRMAKFSSLLDEIKTPRVYLHCLFIPSPINNIYSNFAV